MNSQSIKAVVTGGASGLGRAVTEHLIARGGRVALLDVDAKLGRQVSADLGEASARFFELDVSAEDQAEQVMAEAGDWLGGLSVAVSCAGILGAGRVLGRSGPMALADFARTVTVNLIGTFNVAKAAAGVMQHNEPDADGQRGVIINTASIAAFEGQIGQAAYSASKGGVVGMTLPMAREFTRIGVRVVTIAPGVFHTPMVDRMPDQAQQALGASIPFPKRLGRPAEFAALVAHVIDNRYLNGTTLRLDGAVRLEPK